MANRLSQKDRIMIHLHDYGEITSWEAIKEYGITKYHRLSYKPVSDYKDKINS